MTSTRAAGQARPSEIAFYSIVFLFSFQLMTDFIEGTYAFGLLGLGVPVEAACLLLIFSPLVLAFRRGGMSRPWLLLVTGGLLVCRVLEPLLQTRERMIVSGLGVACFLVFLPTVLWARRDEPAQSRGLALGLGLTFGLALSVLLRGLNSGVDLSTSGGAQLIAWLLAVVAGIVAFRLPGIRAGEDRRGGGATISGLALGATSALVLLYFAFAAPNVIARWTGLSFMLVAAILVAALCLFVLLISPGRLLRMLRPGTVLVWNLLFVLAMAVALATRQFDFPSDAAAYPYVEPVLSWMHHVPVVLMLVLFPVILLDFLYFCRALMEQRPSLRSLGRGFAIGSLFFVAMVFAHLCTAIYDYVPVVGPPLRDAFWLVFLVGGIVLTLPVLLVRRSVFELGAPGPGWKVPGVMVLLAAVTLVGIRLTSAAPSGAVEPPRALKVVTYNIQQGYGATGQRSGDEQLEFLRQLDADIIGLQESDTNRISGGNADLVRFFADNLNMYSYYGPGPVVGTFGIALLSKHPIEDPETFYMYSVGEQTATITARVSVAGKKVQVLVTHLGNDGPMIQQQQFLARLAADTPVVAVGDFNFESDSEQYRVTTGVLDDAWMLRWPQGPEDPASTPAERIDYVFVSPGTRVSQADYVSKPCSDHPAVVAVIEL